MKLGQNYTSRCLDHWKTLTRYELILPQSLITLQDQTSDPQEGRSNGFSFQGSFFLLHSPFVDFLQSNLWIILLRPNCRICVFFIGSEQAFGLQGPEVLGHTGGVRARAADLDDALRGEYVLLLHRGAGLRALLPCRRDQEDHHGS